jgi:hypothetical protein
MAIARVDFPVPAAPRTRMDVVGGTFVDFSTSGKPGGVKTY